MGHCLSRSLNHRSIQCVCRTWLQQPTVSVHSSPVVSHSKHGDPSSLMQIMHSLQREEYSYCGLHCSGCSQVDLCYLSMRDNYYHLTDFTSNWIVDFLGKHAQNQRGGGGGRVTAEEAAAVSEGITVSMLLSLYKMIEASRQSKPNFNYFSAAESPAETDTSLKKKVFARKPAANNTSSNSEKRRKLADEPQKSSKAIVDEFVRDKPPADISNNIVLTTRKERQTENFNKDKDLLTEYASKNPRELFYSPKSHKNGLFAGLFLMQKSSAKEQPKSSANDQQYKPSPNNTCPTRPKDKPPREMDTTFEDISLDSLKNRSISSAALPNYSPMNYCSDNKGVPVDRNSQPEEKGRLSECYYCKNNRKIVDLMSEKQSKLEEQLRTKNGVVKDLAEKCESFRKENSVLIDRLERNLEVYQTKQIQFFQEKQDLLGRMELLKKDLSKLTDKLRYSEIENSMLLRYKDEYSLITQEYDTLLDANEQLKRQIAAAKAENRFTFAKLKTASSLKPDTPKYQFSQLRGKEQRYQREDDDISLNLSERSFDQF